MSYKSTTQLYKTTNYSATALQPDDIIPCSSPAMVCVANADDEKSNVKEP